MTLPQQALALALVLLAGAGTLAYLSRNETAPDPQDRGNRPYPEAVVPTRDAGPVADIAPLARSGDAGAGERRSSAEPLRERIGAERMRPPSPERSAEHVPLPFVSRPRFPETAAGEPLPKPRLDPVPALPDPYRDGDPGSAPRREPRPAPAPLAPFADRSDPEPEPLAPFADDSAPAPRTAADPLRPDAPRPAARPLDLAVPGLGNRSLGPLGAREPAAPRPEPPRGLDILPEPAARPRPPGAPQRPSATGSAYRVQPGDTLSRIAERELGDAGRWREIVAANPGLDPARLKAGEVLSLPGRAAP